MSELFLLFLKWRQAHFGPLQRYHSLKFNWQE